MSRNKKTVYQRRWRENRRIRLEQAGKAETVVSLELHHRVREILDSYLAITGESRQGFLNTFFEATLSEWAVNAEPALPKLAEVFSAREARRQGITQ